MNHCLPVNVIAKRTLRAFWERHADSRDWLECWHGVASRAQWSGLVDIRVDYPSADYVGNMRYVFDVKGDRYRLICKIDFAAKLVLVRFVGTHAEYDRTDAASI